MMDARETRIGTPDAPGTEGSGAERRATSPDSLDSPAEKRAALEAKYSMDRGFNPLGALQVERNKHEIEISNLEQRKSGVFNEPLLQTPPGQDPVEARKKMYDRQIADQRAQAEWFASAVSEAESGNVHKAQTWLSSLEARVAENLRDAFKDEQEARTRLNGVNGTETVDIKRITDTYAAAAEELRAQRAKIQKIQDQKLFLEALAEEKRGAK